MHNNTAIKRSYTVCGRIKTKSLKGYSRKTSYVLYSKRNLSTTHFFLARSRELLAVGADAAGVLLLRTLGVEVVGGVVAGERVSTANGVAGSEEWRGNSCGEAGAEGVLA